MKKILGVNINKYLLIVAVLFWLPCWVTVEDLTMKAIGLTIPYLTLVLTLHHPEKPLIFSTAIILYEIIMVCMTKSFIPYIPHLASCACVIAAVYTDIYQSYIERKDKEMKDFVDYTDRRMNEIDNIVFRYDDNENADNLLTRDILSETSTYFEERHKKHFLSEEE